MNFCFQKVWGFFYAENEDLVRIKGKYFCDLVCLLESSGACSTLSQCTSTTTWCCCWTSLAPISCCDGWNWSARLLGGHRQKNWLTVRLFSRHRSRHTYVRVRKKGNWNCHFHADFEIPLAFIYGLLLFSLASEQFRVFTKKKTFLDRFWPDSMAPWLKRLPWVIHGFKPWQLTVPLLTDQPHDCTSRVLAWAHAKIDSSTFLVI